MLTADQAGIESLMSPEEQVMTGIYKLDQEELATLNRLINQKNKTYHCKIPIVQKTNELKWIYETRKLKDPSNQKIQYDLAISTIYRDEFPYFREWIEYHKLLGVQHFYLYNNLSQDKYFEQLEPYIASGEVELIEWPVLEYPACQLTAYNDALQRTKGNVRWLAFIDIDEFLVPHHHDNLLSFLDEYEDFAGVCINWQLFGTSYIQSLDEDELITENLTHKFPEKFYDPSWNSNYFVKSIIKPERVEEACWSSHYFTPLEGYMLVDPDKLPLRAPWTQNQRVPIDKIQINHYWFRTIDFFMNNKVQKREDVGDMTYTQDRVEWLLEMGHSEVDLKIQRFVPILKAVLEQRSHPEDGPKCRCFRHAS